MCLPDVVADKPEHQKFNRYPIGFLPFGLAEEQNADGKLYLFVGIDRTAKYPVTQLVATADRKTARGFLQHMLEAVPRQIHTILTDQAIGPPLVQKPMQSGIEHRLKKATVPGPTARSSG